MRATGLSMDLNLLRALALEHLLHRDRGVGTARHPDADPSGDPAPKAALGATLVDPPED
jgi:hypothetical protein